MKFELSKEFLDQLVVDIELGNNAGIIEQISQLHPADIADVLGNLSTEEAKIVYSLLDEEVAAESLMELDDEIREQLLKLFSSQEIAHQVGKLNSDDAADLLGELSENGGP